MSVRAQTSSEPGEGATARRGARQAGKFGLVGVFNTLLDFAIFSALRLAGLPILVANVVSATICMTMSFLLNRRFVFGSSGGSWKRQAGLFLAGTAFGLYVLQNGVIALLVHVFPGALNLAVDVARSVGMDSARAALLVQSNAAKAVATVASLTWNFFFYRSVVFAERGPRGDA